MTGPRLTLRQRILRMLRQQPTTVQDLSVKLGVPVAVIRSTIWTVNYEAQYERHTEHVVVANEDGQLCINPESK